MLWLIIEIILAAFNEEDCLPTLLSQLDRQLKQLSPRYEILIVDDGSRDRTAEIAVVLSSNYPIRLLQLSRNFGKESALTAGIDYARGDLIILMDADLQHPPELLTQFFSYWRQGYDMVYGICTNYQEDYVWRRLCRQYFYAFMSH